jgi:hypothetical protein
MHFQAAACNIENFAPIEYMQALLGSGFDFSPEQLHAISEDTRCAGNHFRSINQVRCTLPVYIYLCPRHLLDEGTGSSRVIQVDMGGDKMRHIFWIEACFPDRGQQRFHRAARAGIDDGKLITSRQQVGADDLVFAEERVRDLPCP